MIWTVDSFVLTNLYKRMFLVKLFKKEFITNIISVG